jgi:hypothetical protein
MFMKKPVSNVAFVLSLEQAAENQRSPFDMLRACPEFIEGANPRKRRNQEEFSVHDEAPFVQGDCSTPAFMILFV